MQLETERLILREFRVSDFDAVHEYASDPEVVRYMPFGPNILKQTQDFLDRAINRQKEKTRIDYELAVILKETNKLIGGCRINKVSEIQAHIGYIYNKNYWGYGYATETAKALVAFGFNDLGVHRIYATCDPDNIASQRVLEKAGLILEGRLREDMMIHGEYRDSLIFGLLDNEWKTKKP
jgi:RimJ/RimL family protein N-acetyltransferase